MVQTKRANRGTQSKNRVGIVASTIKLQRYECIHFADQYIRKQIELFKLAAGLRALV